MTNYAYLRVSHIESLTKTSLDTQERTIKSYAKSNGFGIDYVYSEVISGGTDFKKRNITRRKLLLPLFDTAILVTYLNGTHFEIINI